MSRISSGLFDFMSSTKDVSYQFGPGFLGCLALLFIALKLTGFIAWSWWWVTAPLWGGLALVLGVLAITFLVLGIIALSSIIYRALYKY